MNQPPQSGQPQQDVQQPGHHPPYPPPKQRMSTGLKVAIIVICVVVVGLPVLLVVVGAVAYVFLGADSGIVGDQADVDAWKKARIEMSEIHKALSDYMLNHDGEYPKSLDKLTEWYFPSGVPKDPFTQDQYIYKVTEDGFELTCLGKDQKEGGIAPPYQDIRYNEDGLIADER